MQKGRISITSPLARALIGKKKGASVEVVAPGGAKAYEITKVEWRWRVARSRSNSKKPRSGAALCIAFALTSAAMSGIFPA